MALTFFGSLPLRLFLNAKNSIVTSMLSPREIVVRHCFSGSGFSGGELQRVKLASKLDERGQIFILDEPTDGLHLDDIRRLMELFNKMTDQGNTLFIIEHSLDIIKDADYIVELGPEGGLAGGKLLFAGTPKEMIESSCSVPREYLKDSL